MSYSDRFTEKAEDYAYSRPDYASKLMEHLALRHGLDGRSTIADIGTGTGKFAAQLLELGCFVYGVEPNADMRRIALRTLREHPNFCVVEGNDTNTGLESGCADYIAAAQAFHWFEPVSFRRECKRVLKPDGKVILVWNMRDPAAQVNSQCVEIFSKYCPGFRGFSNGFQKDDARIDSFFGKKHFYECVEFDHPIYYQKEQFIRRCLSSSYSLRAGDAGYSAYLDALSALFDAHAEEGILRVENETVAYIGAI